MSLVKANTYQDASGGSNAQLYGVASPPNSMGFRNRIINGDMRVAQRGTSVALGTTPTYFVDRFAGLYSTSVTGTLTQQSTGGLSGFTNCARAQRTSGQTATGNLSVIQILETLNCTDLAGGSVTFSFWARAGANYSAPSSVLSALVYTGTGTDQSSTSFMAGSWTGQTAIVNSGITLTTSWQRFTATGSVGSSATQLGIIFQAALTGTAGANDYFEITGVQFEAGTNASAFERVDYGRQLIQCQRYYQNLGGQTLTGFAENTTTLACAVFFYQQMRASPTCSIRSGTLSVRCQGGDFNTSSPVLANTAAGTNALWTNISGFTGLTTNAVVTSRLTNTDVIATTAEL